MGKSRLLSLLIYLLLKLISLPPLVVSPPTCCTGPCKAISYRNGPCGNRGDSNEYKNHNYVCKGSSDFIKYECNVGLMCKPDELGNLTCQETTPSLQSGGCKQSGTLKCKGCKQSNEDPLAPLCRKGDEPYPTYECSPPITSSTPANLTYNDFSEGGDGGGPSACGGKYRPNTDKIVALSTGWYNSVQCNNMIRIQAKDDQHVDAKVVDECSSMIGCDDEHAGQQPCKNNIVDGSDAVWKALGLNKKLGMAEITWSIIE